MTIQWNTDRRTLLKAGGAFLASLASGSRLAWAVDRDTLRLRAVSDLQVLDPKGIIGELDDIINRCTQVTLIRLGDMRDGNPTSNWGAETVEWKDPQTIAFTLRDGLTWNNGFGPVTSDDVKFSFERIAGSDSAWAYQFEKLDKVEVIDPRSGLIHLKAPFKPFWFISLPYYGGHIVSKAAVEKAGGSYTTQIPAQCGPFLLDKWEQNQKVTLVANPDWKGPKPDFNRIEYFIVNDDQAALLAYEADSFDYTHVALTSAKEVKANPPKGSKLIETKSTRYAWLTINMNAEALKDIRVRQAIQYAYDGDAVIQGAYDGLTARLVEQRLIQVLHQQRVVALRQPRPDRRPVAAQIRAEPGRADPHQQQRLLLLSGLFQDRIKVFLGHRGRKPQQQVVSAQLDHDRVGVIAGQGKADPHPAAGSGVARQAAIHQHDIVMAARLQPALQLRHQPLVGRQAIPLGQAVAEREDTQRLGRGGGRGQKQGQDKGFQVHPARLNRKALVTTKTEDSAIAPAPSIGESCGPPKGTSTPIATGISAVL